MDDGLFLMQRYWGSEDEESIPSDIEKQSDLNGLTQDFKSSQAQLKTKKKKRKLDDNGSYESNTQNVASEQVETVKNKIVNNYQSLIADSSDSEEVKSVLKKKRKRSKNHDKKLLSSNSNETVKSAHAEEGKTNKNVSSDNKDKTVEASNESGLTNHENDGQLFLPIGQVKNQNTEKIRTLLPKWLSKPTVFGNDLKESKIPIENLLFLDENCKKNLQAEKITNLFPVQASVIPHLMENNLTRLYCPSDLCISAPTGSGKTLTFVLPIAQSLKTRVVCAIRAVIVLPVSELAIQVFKVFEAFVRGTDLKVCLLTGQKSFVAEQKLLVQAKNRRILSLTDIVVTTPGRILDHIHRTDGFCLKQLRYLVIDEADRLMDEIQKGWLKQIEEAVYTGCSVSNCVCSGFPANRMPGLPDTAYKTAHINQPLQKLLFSATLSHDPERLHTLSLYKPRLFIAEGNSEGNEYVGKCSIPEGLNIQSIVCKNGTKPMVLCHFLQENRFKKVLCFTESIDRAQRLSLILKEMNLIQVLEISSNHRPVQRKIALEQFNSGKIGLLVCSDLVARGMDIDGVDCVISYDVPHFVKNFVHRIGRTARAGKCGTAVALLLDGEVASFKDMLMKAAIPLPKEHSISQQNLEMYVASFQSALVAADSNLRKIKAEKAFIKTSKAKGNHQPRLAKKF